ncbi:MAG: rhomboid family intramembrane serine protease [Kangiellaceae bacterium]|nr:rhomboid family intramembrane serine protease [Kangiellaceae bacterium]
MVKDFLARAGWMTKVLVIISTAVSIYTFFGKNPSTYYFAFDWELIKQGQLHRLITPIFLHFMIAGLPIHLLFNMMWLWDLGGSLEKAKGPWYLLVIVLIVGVLSNVGQYFSDYMMQGIIGTFHTFGGMSGVVYGLLGFLFMRRKFDPFFPVRIHDGIMKFMLIWLVLGFTGILGNIANAAHLFGLIVGGVIGFITAKIKAL